MKPIDLKSERGAKDHMTVCGEQARLIASSTRSGVATNLVAGAFAAGALLDSPLPWMLVVAWFALLCLSIAFRVWAVTRPWPDGDLVVCRQWLARFARSAGAMGFAWGCLGLAFFLHPGTLPEALIVMCLIGVAGAATASFGVYARAAMAFSVPALLPMTVHYALHAIDGADGSIIAGVMTVMPIIYAVLLYRVARLREASVGQAVAQWEKTHELAEQLRIIADYS